MNLSSPHTRIAAAAGGLSLGLILALAFGVFAEDSELDADPRVIPYNGVLEFDGQPFTGQADFRFELTDDENCDVAEDHEQVDVFGGRFAVNLGTVLGDVPECVFDADRVFLSIAVRPAESVDPHTTLSGRQRINPVPFAYWAAEGSDFRVDGDANILGSANISGSANIGGNIALIGNIATPGANAVAINDDLTVTGAISDPDSDLTINDGLVVTGSVSDSNSNFTINDGLDITGDIQDTNSSVIINDSLDLRGGVSNATGDFTVNDNLDITGDIQDTDGSVIIDDSLDLRGGVSNATGDFTVNDNLDISGDIQDFNSDLTIDDGLVVTNAADLRGGVSNSTGDVVVNDNLTVNGKLLKRVLFTQPGDANAAIQVNGANILTSQAICFIVKMDGFNELEDRCQLGFGGTGAAEHWTYNAREADCSIMCWKWN